MLRLYVHIVYIVCLVPSTSTCIASYVPVTYTIHLTLYDPNTSFGRASQCVNFHSLLLISLRSKQTLLRSL